MPGPELGSKNRDFADQISGKYLQIFGNRPETPEMKVVATESTSIGSQNINLTSEDLKIIQTALTSLAQRESSNEGCAEWIGKLLKQINADTSSSTFFLNNGASVAITLGLHHIQAGSSRNVRANELLKSIDKHEVVDRDSFLKDLISLDSPPFFKAL